MQKHVIKSYAVWDIPNAPSRWGSVGATILLSDWQLSGVLTAGSAYRPRASRPTAARRRTRRNAVANGRYDLTLHVPEQRREREPDRLAGLRGEDRLRRRSGLGLLGQPVRAVQHEGGRPGRPTAASAWNRAATSSAAARITPWTWRLRKNIRVGGSRNAPVPARRLQRVQHGHLQRPRDAT